MTTWYVARGIGLAALVLMTVATCLGTLLSRRSGSAGARYVVQYVHRCCAGLGLAALAVHIGAILVDRFAHVGVIGAVVPLTSAYRPIAVAFGSLAAYSLLAAAVFGLARGRMAGSPRGARLWRRLHGMAYAGWAAGMLHGFLSGTDSALGWVRLIYVLCLVAVASSVVARFRPPRNSTSERFAAAVGALR